MTRLDDLVNKMNPNGPLDLGGMAIALLSIHLDSLKKQLSNDDRDPRDVKFVESLIVQCEKHLETKGSDKKEWR